jgi:hypothetical protein
MPSSIGIRAVVALLAAIMFGLSALTGDSIDEQGLRWLGGSIGAITLLFLAFDRWIWRWPGVRWLVELAGNRAVHGTWRGTLYYERDQHGNPGSRSVYLAIRQTFTTVKLRCYFPPEENTNKGTESFSIMATMEKGDHRHLLRYVFATENDYDDLADRPSTEGTAKLRVVGRPVIGLSGSYYVERNGGRGKIIFDGHSAKVAGSDAEAAGLTYRDLPAPRLPDSRPKAPTKPGGRA